MDQCNGRIIFIVHHQIITDCEVDGCSGPFRIRECVVIED